MKWKGRTRIGVMTGFEYGTSFFQEWRSAKARMDFVERGVDFVIAVSLLNVKELNGRLMRGLLAEKRLALEEEGAATLAVIEDLSQESKNAGDVEKNDSQEALNDRLAEIDDKISRLRIKKSDITLEQKQRFARQIAQELAERVVPPIKTKKSEGIIKYWVFPCPLLELDCDDLGIAALIYDILPVVSKEYHNLKVPYIRVDDIESVVEVEDRVAIRTIGIITPTVSGFRARVLSTPPEREIAYDQTSGFRDLPDFYIGAMFGTSIDEPNPRGVPKGKPYMSAPSLTIRSRLAKRVLPNCLGYAILHLYPERKNRGQYKTESFQLNDARELECSFAKDQLIKIKDSTQRAVAAVILEKVKIGTKVTFGKIEDQTGFKRSQVVDAIKALQGTPFRVELDQDKGEIKNPHTIIPTTSEDLTRYRKGDKRVIKVLLGACFHAGDAGVDYRFIEEDLPTIIHEERTELVILAGDLTEGNKYNQDRVGGTIDCFSTPESHEKLSGWLVANALFESFRLNYERDGRIKPSLPTCVVIPGNHDTGQKHQGPILAHFYHILVPRLIWLIDRYFKRKKLSVNYAKTEILVREKILLLDNPSIYKEFGIIHEHMGGSQQSTYKGQNALKQFAAQPNVRIVALGNYHELNVFMIRIGNQTYVVFTLGTFKRGISPFENVRSKVPEFGIVVSEITMQDDDPVNLEVKLIPGRTQMSMQEWKPFLDRNKRMGRPYHEAIDAWERRAS